MGQPNEIIHSNLAELAVSKAKLRASSCAEKQNKYRHVDENKHLSHSPNNTKCRRITVYRQEMGLQTNACHSPTPVQKTFETDTTVLATGVDNSTSSVDLNSTKSVVCARDFGVCCFAHETHQAVDMMRRSKNTSRHLHVLVRHRHAAKQINAILSVGFEECSFF